MGYRHHAWTGYRHHAWTGYRHHVWRHAPRFASHAIRPVGAGESGGLASWYRGRTRGMTAAHRYLPFGTLVRVTNRTNGRSVVVRINDRGPFIRGRVIDLNRPAATALGVRGVSPVSLRRM